MIDRMSLLPKIGAMKEIPLTQGKIALVDDGDFESVSRFKWHAHFDGYNWYAKKKNGIQGTRKRGVVHKPIAMHNFIMEPPPGVVIDHKDWNGLNNQRHNLRICTQAQNCQNGRQRKGNKSGFKGVSWKKRNKKWCTQIAVFGKVIHVGLFDVATDAARAYDAAAMKYHGEFALTNAKLGLL